MLQLLKTSREAHVALTPLRPSEGIKQPGNCQGADLLEDTFPPENFKAVSQHLRKSLKQITGLGHDVISREMVSAYDRMRTRKFALFLSAGMKSSTAAVVAEKEAIESLAKLARERGIASVVLATKGAIVKRSSCAGRLLKRRSIRTAAMSAISNRTSQRRKEIHKERKSMTGSRTRLRRRASLCPAAVEPRGRLGRESSPSVEDDNISHDSTDEAIARESL